MPEFRRDPVTGRWVIISAERAQRPQPRNLHGNSTNTSPCPFCAGNEGMTPPEVLVRRADQTDSGKGGWTVRVVPNKYPALVNDSDLLVHKDELYEWMNGLGVHEVIIESPEHLENMAMLSEKQLEAVLSAYRDRMLDLRADHRWKYILVYKNQGVEAGATFPHAHSQLVALPIVPKAALEEIDGAKRFYDAAGRCIFCEMIQKERDDRRRIITEQKSLVAFCPYASRFSYETWILPKKHASRFEAGSKDFYLELARILRSTLIRLDRRFDHPPFNYVIHSSPVTEFESDYYHWHMEIMPRLTQVAGFEWGSGFYINPVAPEDAARLLREVAL